MFDEDETDDEEEFRKHIPQGNSPYRRGLWAEAYHWVWWLLSIFGDLDELRVKGLSRRWGLKLSNWLWGLEGALRRLILAAALAMASQETPNAATRAGARPRRSHNRQPVFRVFCLRGSGEAAALRMRPGRQPPAEPKPYGHIPYPSDPLLRLGQPRAQRTPAQDPHRRGSRTPNPLDRRGRLSRRDPDWGQREAEPSHPSRASDPSVVRSRKRAPRLAHAALALPDSLPDSLRDWRRAHDEWNKIVPAPSLAARIYALQRVIADPEALIAATARRLQRIKDEVSACIKDALPLLRPPKRAKIPPFRETGMLIARCHGAILYPDTS